MSNRWPLHLGFACWTIRSKEMLIWLQPLEPGIGLMVRAKPDNHDSDKREQRQAESFQIHQLLVHRSIAQPSALRGLWKR